MFHRSAYASSTTQKSPPGHHSTTTKTTGGSTTTSQSSRSSTRVTINTSRASVSPGTLELDFPGMVNGFLVAGQAPQRKNTSSSQSQSQSQQQLQQQRRGQQLQLQPYNTLQPQAYNNDDCDDQDRRLMEHLDVFDASLETCRVMNMMSDCKDAWSEDEEDWDESLLMEASPPPAAPPAPLSMTRVSPRSILENIEVRARRRRQILQHTLPPDRQGDGVITAVPAVIDHTKNRLRPPSPLSVGMASTTPSPKNGQKKSSLLSSTTKPKSPVAAPTSDATTTLHSNNIWQYWQDRITDRTQRCGGYSYTTVQAWMDLGHAQFKHSEYGAAADTFAKAVQLTQRRGGLPAAMAWHFQGTALSRQAAAMRSRNAQDKAVILTRALNLLQQAYEIRQTALGADHPDTAGTQNSMAWVYYYQHEYSIASQTFWDVFWKRQAVFGPRHPAVAVAATDLARSFGKLQRTEDAHNFYSIALQIYDQMHVPPTNPAVQRLRQELQALEAAQTVV